METIALLSQIVRAHIVKSLQESVMVLYSSSGFCFFVILQLRYLVLREKMPFKVCHSSLGYFGQLRETYLLNRLTKNLVVSG